MRYPRTVEGATQVLAVLKVRLMPGGKLLLVEMVVPADNHPGMAQAMDLNVLVLLGGRERTEAEYRDLLGGAGFRLERVIATHSPFQVLVLEDAPRAAQRNVG